MQLHRILFLAALGSLLWGAPAEARKFLDAIGEADRAILDDLHNGQIVEAHPFAANQNTGHLWKVRVEHQGRSRWALFKPREYGDRDGWDRVTMEVAMYKLNRILGMDMVPPAAYRRGLWVGGNYFAEGALCYFADDAHLALRVGDREWKPGREAFASDLRILQTIGRDADNQNANNLLRARHWKDGTYRVCKVDNAACGRQGATVNLEHAHPEWGPVTRFNPETYARLKELDYNDLRGDVGEFLDKNEIRQWLSLRDGLVREIERRDQEARARGQSVWLGREEIAFDARRRRGKEATAAQLSKFEAMMAKKGVEVEYLGERDPRLGGAVGRTITDGERIIVRLARSKRGGVNSGALLEELVHVNQLRNMARKVGGLPALHTALTDQRSRGVRLAMEEYAKIRLAPFASGFSRLRLRAERARLHLGAARAARTTGKTSDLWRQVSAPRQ